MMDFDDMLVQVGEFGIYQKALFVFQAPFCMFVTFILFGQLFMTLTPGTIWCQDHFNCTHGNMTPGQRQNLTFAYSMGTFNPCFIRKYDIHHPDTRESISLWDTAVVKAIVNWINGEPQGRNFTESLERDSPPTREEVTCAQSLVGASTGRIPARCEDVRSSSGLSRQKRQYGGYGGGQGQGGYGGGQGQGGYGGGYRGEYTEGYGGQQGGNSPQPPTTWTGPRPSSETDSQSPTGWPSPSGGIPGSRNTGSGQATFDNRRKPGNEGQSSGAEGNRGSSQSGSIPTSTGDSSGSASASSSRGQQAQITCFRNVSVALRNTSFIFMLERNETSPNVSRHFLAVEQCKNVTWDRWNPNTDVPYPTIVTDGMWWCNAEAYNTISTAVFFVGAIVGGFLIGWIADSYGRVPALVVANLLGAIGGALSVSTTNFYLFTFFRFITGMAFDNCFTMMYILVLEFCGPTYRTLVANLSIAVFYTLGTILLPLLARWIGNWQIYGLAISLPMLLGLFALFLVPESARWLLSKGRTAEATNILRSFAKVNRKEVPETVFATFEQDAQQLFDSMKDSEEEEVSFLTALKTPRLRKTFILLTLIWSFIALVYDGHSRNILNLANADWDVFTMFMIASMTEFPADVMLIFTLDRFGRRWLSFGALTLSGAASIIAAAVPENVSFTVTLVLAMVARFFVNVAFNIGLQYAAELLPTIIRAQGVNAIHIMGYVASIVSPFIAMIGRTNRALSLILLGAFAIAGGFLSLFLSETLGEDLPNTLEEAENFGKNQSFWNCPICAPPREDYERPEETVSEEDVVVRRNKWRSSNTGAIYRSSMISHSRSSRGSSGRPGPEIALNPIPSAATETTRLRRTIN